MIKCDPVTGACLLPEQNEPLDSHSPTTVREWAVR